jgi:hypothetical protein
MIGWLTGKAAQWLTALVAGLALLAGFFAKAKRDARKDIEHDQLQDSVERQERGEKAVRDGRASGDSPADRVRKNDGAWD